jgi:hypothetical protein
MSAINTDPLSGQGSSYTHPHVGRGGSDVQMRVNILAYLQHQQSGKAKLIEKSWIGGHLSHDYINSHVINHF